MLPLKLDSTLTDPEHEIKAVYFIIVHVTCTMNIGTLLLHFHVSLKWRFYCVSSTLSHNIFHELLVCVNVSDSVLASWTDAIDNTHEDGADVNSALIDSDVSSEKASSDSSDPEAAFLADADFAVAVARAAELSGMTVIGSTIVDPNAQREREKGC